ncbi:putative ubiquitin carboxyl-terminal hydrolase 11 isoform X2 [Capsella rubella]|uniref:putative ubiquitin carboxyl-terminal hydrolase 11 isoform X2 n=1 Tax=Capsella rubella TaxID=81985 RepID=UPI000CD531AE|nr:putative ubiquitin carboxyl-terminal hydrolase 11 isoform X2 [Capsella rubella]
MKSPTCESIVEIGVSDMPPTPEEQRHIVTELTLQADENFFLVSNSWYTRWKKFVGLLTSEELSRGEPSEVSNPGEVSNHDLLDSRKGASDPQHRKLLVEGVDFILVPEKVWKKLIEWYKGGPPIPDKIGSGITDCVLGLPDDLVLQILLRVPKNDDQMLSCVCRKFQHLVRSNELNRLRRKRSEEYL